MGSNEDNSSLCRFNETQDEISILEKQHKTNISELETKITELIR